MGLIESASSLAIRYLSRERLLAVRASYYAGRAKLYPLMRAVYGTFDASDLREHLAERLGSFEILMVHSSVNHMEPTYTGSPLDLVKMLIDFCGPQRTLVMPAFYFGDSSIGGAGETFRANPRFDVRRTQGVTYSRHPVYRVCALGPLAKALTQGHESAGSACGRGTPFDFMAHHDT